MEQQKPQVPKIQCIPNLKWINATNHDGEPVWDGLSLQMRAGARTDWFIDPDGSSRTANAPALVFEFDHDSSLEAWAQVHSIAKFDAAVLFVYQSDTCYAKLCVERAPDGGHYVVSVVTNQYSDDCNGPPLVIPSKHLRVSRSGPVVAFHYTVGENKLEWRLLRLFRLPHPDAPTWAGFMAQSPVGNGCTTKFRSIQYAEGVQPNPRDVIEYGAQ